MQSQSRSYYNSEQESSYNMHNSNNHNSNNSNNGNNSKYCIDLGDSPSSSKDAWPADYVKSKSSSSCLTHVNHLIIIKLIISFLTQPSYLDHMIPIVSVKEIGHMHKIMEIITDRLLLSQVQLLKLYPVIRSKIDVKVKVSNCFKL